MRDMPEEVKAEWEAMTPEERKMRIEVAWFMLRDGKPEEGPFTEWLAEQDAAHQPCGCPLTEHIGAHCKRCKQLWPCNTHTLVQGYQFQQPMPADRMQA